MAEPTSELIANGVTYQCHPHHRNRNPNKSQWTITETEEIGCFRLTWVSAWIVDSAGWGLHLVNGSPDYLGMAQDRHTRVFIAKFVSNGGQAEWHGYPADHGRTSDRPHDEVIGTWLADRTLPAAKIRKIQKGEPCNL